MKNLNKLIFAFFMVFNGLRAFSQHNVVEYPLIEQRGLDTIIVFKLEQGRKMAIFNEERKKMQKVVELQNLEIIQRDSVINHQSAIINNYELVDQANQVIINEKSNQISARDSQLNLANKEIKKQKRHKWFAIISGVTTTGLLTWFSITH